MIQPLISIIVPCYNQGQYLNQALQSVYDQTYINWECIIVNDGSSDSTKVISEKWLKKDARYKYLYQKNSGLSSARNAALDLALGDYIQFLDADDVLDEKKIELSLCGINKKSFLNICISNFKMFYDDISKSSSAYCDLNLDLITFKNVLYNWDFIFNIPIHCGLFQNTFFLDFRFPDALRGKEDWLMWLCFLKKTPHVYFTELALVYYRSNPKGLTKDSLQMLENYFKALTYLQKIISPKEYSQYLEHALHNKSLKIIGLENKINNYQGSRSYKIVQKIKRNKVVLNLFRIVKKFN